MHEDERGLLGFRHVLACKAVYEAISGPERRRLHLRAARVLEELSPLPVAQLARHFRAAGETGEWCRYAEQAADLALAAGDDKTAASLLHDLAANAVLPAAAVVRLTRKIPLYALTGAALLGDLAHALRSVLDSDALTPALRAEGRSQLGRILLSTDQYPAGVAELERAIPGLAHRPVEAAQAMVRLGLPGRTLWPAAVHRRWLDRAAATVTASPIPAGARMELTVNRATALLQLGDESGWVVAAEVPETAGTSEETQHIARGCMNTGDVAMVWGRYGHARKRLMAGLELIARHEYPRLHDGILETLAHLDWFTGAWTGLAERAAALSVPDAVNPLIRLEAMLVAGLLDAATGGRAAEDRLRRVLDESRRCGDLYHPLEPTAALVRLRLADGHVGDALALTEEAIQVIVGKGIWLWATDIAPARIRALVAAGRSEEAAGLEAAFARGLRSCSAPAPRAGLATCRAVLAESLPDAVRAARLFAHAAAAWQALPRPYDALLATERQAVCLLRVGKHDNGLALLTDVRQGLITLGARADADRVVSTLRDYGVAARWPRRGRRAYGDELSPREVEVVQLLVAGQTSQEIADALCRSPKTVNTQLASAIRKLGVSSRTALVARAIESGIAAASAGGKGLGTDHPPRGRPRIHSAPCR